MLSDKKGPPTPCKIGFLIVIFTKAQSHLDPSMLFWISIGDKDDICSLWAAARIEGGTDSRGSQALKWQERRTQINNLGITFLYLTFEKLDDSHRSRQCSACHPHWVGSPGHFCTWLINHTYRLYLCVLKTIETYPKGRQICPSEIR